MTGDGQLVGPVALRLVRVQVPLRRPHRAAHGEERRREVILVRWTRQDGVHGWGECPTLSQPGYATETTEVAWRALVNHLGPRALAGAPFDDPSDDPAAPAEVRAAPAATAALADASLDAALRARGESLHEHLGATRDRLDRCTVLADLGGATSEVVARARDALAGGASMVKVKVAPGHEGALHSVVAALGADRVAADANGSYRDPDELGEIDRLGLRYLEQPFSPTLGWDELAELHAALRSDVALDESLTSLDALTRGIRSGALAVASIKPARLGGIERAAQAARLAAASGIEAFVGGMLELGVGRAGAAAVAALPACGLPTDLGPSGQYVDHDVTDPVECDAAGRLIVPTGPGAGRVPDEDALARVAVDELLLGD